jgi:hypothetical protein
MNTLDLAAEAQNRTTKAKQKSSTLEIDKMHHTRINLQN